MAGKRGLQLSDLISVDDAVAQLNVSARRVRQYLEEGRIPGRQMYGRFWVIDGRDLGKFKANPTGYHGHRRRLAALVENGTSAADGAAPARRGA